MCLSLKKVWAIGRVYQLISYALADSRASLTASLASPSFSSALPETCLSRPLASCFGLPMIFPCGFFLNLSRDVFDCAIDLVFVHDVFSLKK